MQFRASNRGEIEGIAALLEESFHVSSRDPHLDRSYLYWKYYEEGPSWPGSRSYILVNDGQILAHAAIWPVELRLGRGVRCGIGFGDWAASEKHRGAGLLLLKELQALASFVLVTGGAQITREILPRMKFEHWANRPKYARVLRPLRQASMRSSRLGAEEPLRLLRNWRWSLSSSSPAQDWRAEESVPDDRALSPVRGQAGSIHSSEFLRYMGRCPTVKLRFLSLCQGSEVRGYSVLSEVGGQARIADIRIASEDQKDWNMALAAVVSFVKSQTPACEVIAVGSVPKLNNALVANGFRLRGSMPLVVYDSQGEIAREPDVQLGMLEDDASVLPKPAFLT
jgi:hypothetical protein